MVLSHLFYTSHHLFLLYFSSGHSPAFATSQGITRWLVYCWRGVQIPCWGPRTVTHWHHRSMRTWIASVTLPPMAIGNTSHHPNTAQVHTHPSATLNMITYDNKYTAALPHNGLIFSKYVGYDTAYLQNINLSNHPYHHHLFSIYTSIWICQIIFNSIYIVNHPSINQSIHPTI